MLWSRLANQSEKAMIFWQVISMLQNHIAVHGSFAEGAGEQTDSSDHM